MTEEPHEKHNRIAMEVAAMLVKEFATPDRMVVLESIVTAITGTLERGPNRYLVAYRELVYLAQAVGRRLNEAEARK